MQAIGETLFDIVYLASVISIGKRAPSSIGWK